MRVLVLHIILLILTGTSLSQETVATLSQNSILIGKTVVLTYSVELTPGSKTGFKPETAVLPSRIMGKNGTLAAGSSDLIEVVSPFKDTVFKDKKKEVWAGMYEITAWDSGSFVITGPTILIDDSLHYFPDIQLNVDLVKANKGQDIYDIKEAFADIPDEPFNISRFLKEYGWIIAIALILLISYLWMSRRNKHKPEPKIRELSLKDKTLLAIDALEKERLWEQDKLKEHYIELSFILRSYLSSRYEINLLERTTKETKLLLEQKGLHAETIRVIISILGESDMVKFAKSKPDEIAVMKVSQKARQVVAETSPIEFENA
ncbi:MAG: hypothetical protein ACK457_12785 [Flavobacteriia bacterium]